MAEKRKKSGATYRREKKQRMEEDKRLGSFMDGFLQRHTAKKRVESILDFQLICHLHSGTYC